MPQIGNDFWFSWGAEMPPDMPDGYYMLTDREYYLFQRATLQTYEGRRGIPWTIRMSGMKTDAHALLRGLTAQAVTEDGLTYTPPQEVAFDEAAVQAEVHPGDVPMPVDPAQLIEWDADIEPF